MSTPAPPLSDRVLARDPRAVARAISLIENASDQAAALLARLYPHTGRAYLIGVTGPPGAGKSTLVDRLITELRAAGSRVAVIAVDPTSPYTGGAILGDRVRMQSHAEDPDVFIRSMATRGHLGGLATATTDAALVLDAAGFDTVIVETVGVGQDEVDIIRTADIVLVTLVPGAGDEVQALKAGIMEIADVFVVNKADREGADRAVASIEAMLSLGTWDADRWKPPVMMTEATTGRGVPELAATVAAFKAATSTGLAERRRARVGWSLRELLSRRFLQHVEDHVLTPGAFDALVGRLAARELDPFGATDEILRKAGVRFSSMTLHHVGVAVRDAAPLVECLRTVFGLETDAPEVVGPHQVRFVDTGECRIELVEPLDPEGVIARFLEKRGDGLHHLCLRVHDIEASVADLVARGIRMIDASPRPGAHGSRIAFIHPSSTGGLLVELKQDPSQQDDRHAPR